MGLDRDGARSDASTVIVNTESGELTSLRGRPKVHSETRVCTEPDCTTTLSRYNPERKCYLHSQVQAWASLRISKRR
jgi:hypothetical protein